MSGKMKERKWFPLARKSVFTILNPKWRISLKKTFPIIDRKKLSLAGVSEKWKKNKKVPTSQKISCLLARISSFLENCFFLIPVTFSTSSKIALTKKTLFPLGRNSFSNSWIKDFEKSVTTIRKSCFYFKKSLKKMVFNGSSSKIDFYLISIIVSTSRKNLRIKQYRFQ